MGFETQRHRGTQRSGGSGENSYQGASKALGVHPGKRGPRTAAPDYHPLWGTGVRRAIENSWGIWVLWVIYDIFVLCDAPSAISACKASSTSPGCNPGSVP
jgi:hypothetical protein